MDWNGLNGDLMGLHGTTKLQGGAPQLWSVVYVYPSAFLDISWSGASVIFFFGYKKNT